MKEIISTDLAPKAIGPYSQAVRVTHAQRLLFTSGQIPLDPATGEMVEGDVRVQTRRVLDNLAEVIRSSGFSLADVVKTTVFLKNIADFPLVNEVYSLYFPGEPPARTTVEVASLPRNALVEIEAVCAA